MKWQPSVDYYCLIEKNNREISQVWYLPPCANNTLASHSCANKAQKIDLFHNSRNKLLSFSFFDTKKHPRRTIVKHALLLTQFSLLQKLLMRYTRSCFKAIAILTFKPFFSLEPPKKIVSFFIPPYPARHYPDMMARVEKIKIIIVAIIVTITGVHYYYSSSGPEELFGVQK